jgi:hypothetical protein
MDLVKALLGNGSVNTPAARMRNKIVPSDRQCNSNTSLQQFWQQKKVFPMYSVPSLYNKNVFAAEIRIVQKSTESRTAKTGIRELDRVLENRKSKVTEDFIVIWSDSSCVQFRCQETESMS